MITIAVDKKICKGDGRCVEICPMQILKMNAQKQIPEFIDGGGEMCINCGHCFAVCPHGAIRLSTMGVEDTARLDYAALPGPAQVELLLKGRRSIRSYTDEPVSKPSVEKLLDIARYAPSGINRQPVNWAVVLGKERVQTLGALTAQWMQQLIAAKSPMAESLRFDRLVAAREQSKDLICRNAPCMIIAYGLKDDPMVPQSCTIAATYLELAAFGSGLGACWAGYVNMAVNMSEVARKFVGISAHAQAGAAMMVGYPEYRYSRIPARNPARIIWK
ncbi:MAG TPA: nitroreductase family protein [Candidatus Omnitrophota bacterium]|nr:nitroreductase family protein [Candidatus Omnitrophota bacterium]HRZ15517.1 nitroreductase family protein [Candidatus Omnitrophota bacterium]